jgi:hypothetical protein
MDGGGTVTLEPHGPGTCGTMLRVRVACGQLTNPQTIDHARRPDGHAWRRKLQRISIDAEQDVRVGGVP